MESNHDFFRFASKHKNTILINWEKLLRYNSGKEKVPWMISKPVPIVDTEVLHDDISYEEDNEEDYE